MNLKDQQKKKKMIEQKPFTKYNLDEENKRQDTFTVRLNEKERNQLNRMKSLLDLKSDSTALKEFAIIGLNVLHHTFSERFLTYLFKKERTRLSDFE